MTNSDTTIDATDSNPPQPERRTRQRANMHDGIPVWYDCCSCEAEPYWAALAEETDADHTGSADDEADETRL